MVSQLTWTHKPNGTFSASNAAPYLSGSGSLQVLSGPVIGTNPTNLVATVNSGNLVLNWPTDHVGWTLQWQTNTPGMGLNTNWLVMPGSSIVNMLTDPIYIGNGSIFFRLASP